MARRDTQRASCEGLTADRDCRCALVPVGHWLGLPVMIVTHRHGFVGRSQTVRFLSREAQIQNERREECTENSGLSHTSRLSTLPVEW